MLVLEGHSASVRCVDYCPGKPILASGSQDGAVKLWDLTTAKLLAVYAHKGSVETLAFSPAGDRLLSGCARGSLFTLPTATPTVRPANLEGLMSRVWHKNSVRQLSYAPDSSSFLVVDWNGTVQLWNGKRRGRHLTFPTNDGVATCGEFSSGADVFAASDRGVIKVWEAQSGREQRRFDLPVPVSSMTLSRDGKRLAVGTAPGEIHLFDLLDGTSQRLSGHTWVVYSLRFTPNGLLSGSADGTVRIWNENGLERAAYCWRHKWINAVAVSPDGTSAAAACADGAVVLFDLF